MKMVVTILWILAIIAGLVLLVFLSVLTYKIYLKRTTAINTFNGVSSLEEITLGNVTMGIYQRDRSSKSRINLFTWWSRRTNIWYIQLTYVRC